MPGLTNLGGAASAFEDVHTQYYPNRNDHRICVDVAVLGQNVSAVEAKVPTLRIQLAAKSMSQAKFLSLFYMGHMDVFCMETNLQKYTAEGKQLVEEFAAMHNQAFHINGDEDGTRIALNLKDQVQRFYECGDESVGGFDGVGKSECWDRCSKINFEKQMNKIRYIWGDNEDCAKPLCSRTWNEVQEEVNSQANLNSVGAPKVPALTALKASPAAHTALKAATNQAEVDTYITAAPYNLDAGDLVYADWTADAEVIAAIDVVLKLLARKVELRVTTLISNNNPSLPPVEVVFCYHVDDFSGNFPNNTGSNDANETLPTVVS